MKPSQLIPSQQQQSEHHKHLPSFEELEEHCYARSYSYQPSKEAHSAAAQSSVGARESNRNGSSSSLSDNEVSTNNIENNHNDDSQESAVSSSSSFKEEDDRFFGKGEFLIPTECFSKQMVGQQQYQQGQIRYESDLEGCSEEKQINQESDTKVQVRIPEEEGRFHFQEVTDSDQKDQQKQVDDKKVVTQQFNEDIKIPYNIGNIGRKQQYSQEILKKEKEQKEFLPQETNQNGQTGNGKEGDYLKEDEQERIFKDEVYNYMDARLKIASEGNYVSGGGRIQQLVNEESENNRIVFPGSDSQIKMKTDSSLQELRIEYKNNLSGEISERSAKEYPLRGQESGLTQQQQEQTKQHQALEIINETNRRQLQLLEIEKEKVQKLLLDKQRRLRLHEMQQSQQQQQQSQTNQGQSQVKQQEQQNKQQQIENDSARINKKTNSKNVSESEDSKRLAYLETELQNLQAENVKLHNSLSNTTSELKQFTEELELELETTSHNGILKKIRSIKSTQKQNKKFITCILDMVQSCTTPVQTGQKTSKPLSSLDSSPGSANAYANTLKTAWKWLKFIMEDYVAMKRATQLEKPNKNSNMYKSCLLDNSNKPEVMGSNNSGSKGSSNSSNGSGLKSDAIVLAEISGILGTESKYDALRVIKDLLRQNQVLHNHLSSSSNQNANIFNANLDQLQNQQQLQQQQLFHQHSSSRLNNLPVAPPQHHPTIFSPSSSTLQLQRYPSQQLQSQPQQGSYPQLKSKNINKSPAPSLASQEYIQQAILSGNVSPLKIPRNTSPPPSQNDISSLNYQIDTFKVNSSKMPFQQKQIPQQQQQQQQFQQLRQMHSSPPKQVVFSAAIPNSGSQGNTRVNTLHLSPRNSAQSKQSSSKVATVACSSQQAQQQQQQQQQQHLGVSKQSGTYFSNPYLQFGQK